MLKISRVSLGKRRAKALRAVPAGNSIVLTAARIEAITQLSIYTTNACNRTQHGSQSSPLHHKRSHAVAAMGLTCAKAARPQTAHEEDAAAQDRTDDLLDRWSGGELARLQRVYRRHARPPQDLVRSGFVAALRLEALPAAHIDALFDRFRTKSTISCRDFCATLSWWCRGDALERRAFLFCWFAGCADPEDEDGDDDDADEEDAGGGWDMWQSPSILDYSLAALRGPP